MTKSHPAGGTRTLVGLISTFALVGGVVHARAGRVDLRAAALFGGSGMLGAPLGAQVTHAVAPRVLMLLFALLMLLVGTLMLRGRGVARPGAARPHPFAVPAAGLRVGPLTAPPRARKRPSASGALGRHHCRAAAIRRAPASRA